MNPTRFSKPIISHLPNGDVRIALFDDKENCVGIFDGELSAALELAAAVRALETADTP